MDVLLFGKLTLPFAGEAFCRIVVQRHLPLENVPGKSNIIPGRLKSVQLQPGTVFTFIPEWCSELSPEYCSASSRIPHKKGKIHSARRRKDGIHRPDGGDAKSGSGLASPLTGRCRSGSNSTCLSTGPSGLTGSSASACSVEHFAIGRFGVTRRI
jgi:hypothetical protein